MVVNQSKPCSPLRTVLPGASANGSRRCAPPAPLRPVFQPLHSQVCRTPCGRSAVLDDRTPAGAPAPRTFSASAPAVGGLLRQARCWGYKAPRSQNTGTAFPANFMLEQARSRHGAVKPRCGPSVFNTSSICCAKFNCFDIGFILYYTCLDSNSLLLPRQTQPASILVNIISHFIE